MAFFKEYDMKNKSKLLVVLNSLYAGEVIATQQYYNHAVAVKGIFSTELQNMFEEHAADETEHAAALRRHIMVMGGTLTNSFKTMLALAPTTANSPDVFTSPSARAMMLADLQGEEDAISMYTEVALAVRDTWPLTFDIISDILEDEYDHRSELESLLAKDS